MNIKDFFKQKWVKYTAWAMVAVGLIALLLGGMTEAEISSGVKMLFVAIAAIGAAIAFITGETQKK